ncbi:hypothetical protein DL768_005227 [Monosporascus sp. mg162]|nr:hypothetical protein DL768_005227 [Monosporascus sp. mg162]
MDAKPSRLVRPAPSAGNENFIPPTKQTIHQRHKSTSNLLSMASGGNLSVAAKRSALADSSNTSKSVFPPSNSGAMVKKNSNTSTNTMTIVKGQENGDLQTKPKDTLSRPAQRLSKAGSVAYSASMAQIKPLPIETQPQRASKQHWPWKRPSKPMVYNDGHAEKERETSEALNAAALKKTVRDSAAPSQAEPSIRQPRHHQSQPVLKSTQAGLRNQPSADFQNTTIPSTIGDMPPTHARDGPDRPLSGWGLVPEPTEKSESNGQPGRELSGWDLLLDPTENGKWDSYPDRIDDDVTGAPYLDAVEEIPREDQYPVQASIDKPLIPIQTLPEPTIPAKALMRTEVKTVDFQSHLPSVPAEDHPELSDYDEDYYDDQGYTTAHSNRSRGDNTTGGATTVMFPPKLSKKDAAELETAKQIVESKRTDEEVEEEAWDVSMVAEYGDEIFDYMRELEMTMLPNAHYMDIQTEIRWSMRSILMDWVIQVHTRFGLLPETLFLTVNYIDRFLSYKVVSLGKLQLVGATAIFVAAKYEEINCPSVQEIVYMVDGGYSIDEILKAERFMLSMLNFELGWPGPMSFLRRISKADDYDLESRTLSKYFLEVTLMDERFVSSPPSYIAAGAHCLSRLILEKGDWTPAHVHYSGYTFSQLKPLVGMILDCCRIARKHHAAVYEKYADRKYKRVSTFVENQLQKGFRLPFQRTMTQPLHYSPWNDEASLVRYSVHQDLKMPIPTEG